ncbi:MAG: nuclear transport factor 2 family protein [Vicinamibacterales bacterium]|nr:nuclear transport factor 2 family protein [Vicinamibacterales bacterium]
MKRFLALFLAMTATAVLVAADPVDAVRQSGAGWRQGAIEQNKALLEKYLAEDLVYMHGGGQTQDKAEYMKAVLTGPSHYEAMTDRGTKVRIYGKVAVLTGPVDVKPPKGELYRVQTLEVYTQNGNGVWQMAQKESVRIPLK